MTSSVFPFSAIVAQDEMKLALLIAAVDASIGGVLVFGDRGTGKSTAVRALAALLPRMRVAVPCRYGCDPEATRLCDECTQRRAKGELKSRLAPVPVVDLPLGATEDRVVGALDLERALAHGEKVFEPGLLARAHRGFLYIDEVNLLEDHLVDLLLDFAASGENVVVAVPDAALENAARLCMAHGTDGLRGELTLMRAARAAASLEGAKSVTDAHLRRNPLDEAGSTIRVERALGELLGT